MPERIESGHYRVAIKSEENEDKGTEINKEYRVVKGEVANGEGENLRSQYGFKDSKWYVYEIQNSSVMPSLKFSPTAPNSSFKKNFSELRFAQEEFDSKSAAVQFIEDAWLDKYSLFDQV